MADRKVIVVGGGLSGLAAAWRLERAGVATTVLEAGDRPGGRVRTERVGGYIVDTGPDAATAGYEIRLTTGSGAAQASNVMVLGMLAAWSGELVNLEGGFDTVPAAIAQRLPDVRYGAVATAVEESGDGVVVRYSDDQLVEGDGCVIG